MAYWDNVKTLLTPGEPEDTLFLIWLLGTRPTHGRDLLGRLFMGSMYFAAILLFVKALFP